MTHQKNCTGCPVCDPEMASLLTMSPEQQARYNQRKISDLATAHGIALTGMAGLAGQPPDPYGPALAARAPKLSESRTAIGERLRTAATFRAQTALTFGLWKPRHAARPPRPSPDPYAEAIAARKAKEQNR